MSPRLFVVPSWLALLAFSVACFAAYTASEAVSTARVSQRALVACEARAQASLVNATQCSGHLTTCLGAVSRIADELEIERVTF